LRPEATKDAEAPGTIQEECIGNMRYCPSCGTEYEDFARECMDCHVALASASDSGAARELSEPQDVKLAAIRTFMGFTASSDAEFVKNLLEAEGIPCVLTGANSARLSGLALDVRLLVREEDAERAAHFLEEYSDDASPNGESP
jgi:Putative prokaryotic signal transducing protein